MGTLGRAHQELQGFVLCSCTCSARSHGLIGQRVHNTLLTAHIPLSPAPGPHASGIEALLSETEPLTTHLSVVLFSSFHSNHVIWKDQPFLAGGWNGCQYYQELILCMQSFTSSQKVDIWQDHFIFPNKTSRFSTEENVEYNRKEILLDIEDSQKAANNWCQMIKSKIFSCVLQTAE